MVNRVTAWLIQPSRELVGRVALVVGTMALAITMAVWGSGVASADDPLAGQTYAKAKDTVKGWGLTPVISTVFGGVLAIDDCKVTRSQRNKKAGTYLLSLNCNPPLATATNPGYSVASPEGRAAKAKQDQVAWLRSHPEWCVQAKKDHPEWFPMEGCEES